MGGLVSRGVGREASGRVRPSWAQQWQNPTPSPTPSPGSPEMSPEVLKALYEAGPAVKTELKNTTPEKDSKENQRVRSRFSKLRRDASPPPGRLTEAQLVQALNWRADKSAPPIEDVLALLGAGADPKLATSLLVHYGTPQITTEKSGTRAGYWVPASSDLT